ncbi:MAG: nickel pincer cofactor biosynthesis protein LarC [Planctomycetes bacterium]|nr:nickel pincer cofactor biosynthesis protein LarC [Planctomycetota bacterium]
MRIAILDAFAGVAGDMWVGALLDAGVPLQPLHDAVQRLRLPGVSIRAERVLRAGLSGTHFQVATSGLAEGQFAPLATAAAPRQPGTESHRHRGLAEIERIVAQAELPGPVLEHCLAVYRAIGAVEAAAHGVDIQHVHFHEVGAEDTIVDVVCACLGAHLLGVERWYANGIQVGAGTVRAAHGVLPVPAPATAALLRGIPVRSGARGECTTPTGAALLRTLVAGFDQPLAYTATAVGYGAGTRDNPDLPNLLRLTVAELTTPGSATELVELQCQVDTATGEQIGWLLDALLAQGAVDAFATPVTMKKGRPGVLLTVLADPARQQALTAMLLEEGSTLGVRSHRVLRTVLERWQETRATPFGPVLYKVARLPSGAVVARPEDAELQRLTAAHGLGRAELLRRLPMA